MYYRFWCVLFKYLVSYKQDKNSKCSLKLINHFPDNLKLISFSVWNIILYIYISFNISFTICPLILLLMWTFLSINVYNIVQDISHVLLMGITCGTTYAHKEKSSWNLDVHPHPQNETLCGHQSFLLAICEKAYSKQWSITFDITTKIVQAERQWLMFWCRLIYANALSKSHAVELFYTNTKHY